MKNNIVEEFKVIVLCITLFMIKFNQNQKSQFLNMNLFYQILQ